MSALVKRFLTWWLTGLHYLLPTRTGNSKQTLPAHLHIEANEEGLVFEARDEAGQETDRHQLDEAHGNEHALRRWLAPHLDNALPVLLRLPREQTLVPSLKLPRMAEKDIRNVLSFELERQTPFPTDQVFYDFYSKTHDTDPDKLDVTLVVVRRSSIKALVARLEPLGILPDVIDAVGATYQEYGINVRPPKDTPQTSTNTFALGFSLYALAAILLVAVVTVPVSRTATAVGELRTEIALRKTEIKEYEALKSEYEQRLLRANFFTDLNKGRLRVIDILAEVTRVLPDNNWLNRFEMDGNKGRFRGESENASSLIPLFEISKFFREVHFASPVTRNNTTGRDRFFLTADIGQEP